jgi:hypothetical protein
MVVRAAHALLRAASPLLATPVFGVSEWPGPAVRVRLAARAEGVERVSTRRARVRAPRAGLLCWFLSGICGRRYDVVDHAVELGLDFLV